MRYSERNCNYLDLHKYVDPRSTCGSYGAPTISIKWMELNVGPLAPQIKAIFCCFGKLIKEFAKINENRSGGVFVSDTFCCPASPTPPMKISSSDCLWLFWVKMEIPFLFQWKQIELEYFLRFPLDFIILNFIGFLFWGFLY